MAETRSSRCGELTAAATMEDSGATGEPDAVSASGLTGPGLTTTFLFAGGTVSVVCLLSVVWQ